MAKKAGSRVVADVGPEAAIPSCNRTGLSRERPVQKAETFRAALKDGIDTPEEGVKFIKEKFGLDLPNQMLSSYKSLEKKRGGEGGKPAPRAPRSATPGHSNPGDLARQIKARVEAHGAEAVRQMADVFAE